MTKKQLETIRRALLHDVKRLMKERMKLRGEMLTEAGMKMIERSIARELEALHALPVVLIAIASEHEAEIDILTDRLCRRFDLGMALNEAAQRAQVKIRAAGAAEPYYTEMQRRSLIGQEHMLMRAVRAELTTKPPKPRIPGVPVK